MSTISDSDDPRPAVEAGVELTEAVLSALAQKPPGNLSQQKDNSQAQAPEVPELKDSELIPAFLERIPEDLRDGITLQIGSFKVLKDGEPKKQLSKSQANTLRTLLKDPSKTTATIKAHDFYRKCFLKVSGGKVHLDLINMLPKQPVEQVSAPSLAVPPPAPAPEPVAQTLNVAEQAIAPGADQKALIDAIARLEARVAELEQRITQKPLKLVNAKVGNWINGIRDNIAAQLHQTTDKIAQRVHNVADKISATTTEKVNEIKDSVSEKVDDIKHNVTETVSDIRENVTDGLDFAREVTFNTVNQAVDAGMQRHNEAIAKVNGTAQEVASAVKQVVANPSQTFLDKVATPAVQRMFDVAENSSRHRVTTDDQGNKNLAIGTYQYQLSKTGEVSVHRSGEKVTADNLTEKDIAEISEMKQAITPKQSQSVQQRQKIVPPMPQKIVPPKVKV